MFSFECVSGEFRGAACQDCNTKMRVKRNLLPVFFHNARGYDNHLLCQHALGDMQEWDVDIIPQTKEKYISMSATYPMETVRGKDGNEKVIKMKIEFKDSYQFLLSSLDKLVKALDPSQLIHSKKVDATSSAKGIFPYEWFDSLEKLECKSLPSQDCFKDS